MATSTEEALQQPEVEPEHVPSILPRPRRWPRRLLIVLNIFVALSLIGVGSGYVYARVKFGDIKKVAIDALRKGPDNPGKVMNVLLVGSDTRADLSDAKNFGGAQDVGGQRSDTIMILHVDPKQKKAAILSFPRDLYVPLANGDKNRINAAFNNGPDLLIKTINQDFGIDIDHYVEVNFDGFKGIVNAIGGINVYFPAPARDAFSGLRIGNAGCSFLNGEGALAYVRSRHYQYFEGGRWHDEGDGDLGRINRQQDFIRRVLKKVRNVRNPFTLNSLISTGVSNVTIDKGLGIDNIRTLAGKFQSLSPDTVDMETVPTTPTAVRIGGLSQSVLLPKQPDMQSVINQFLGRTPPPAPAGQAPPPGVVPSSVRVRVLNGNGISGEATKVAGDLGPSGIGFNVAGTGDADSFKYSQSVISYGPGQQTKAQLLNAALATPAQLKPDNTLKAVDVVLVVGNDFSGVHPVATTGATASTTAPPTTAGPAGGKATGKSPADSC